MNQITLLTGISVGAYSLLLGWLFLLHQKEKTLAVYRAKDMHDKIREQRLEVDQRILEILDILRKMMPQTEVKDFVDREFKPVHKSLSDLNAEVKKNSDISTKLLTNVQVLIDRDNK